MENAEPPQLMRFLRHASVINADRLNHMERGSGPQQNLHLLSSSVASHRCVVDGPSAIPNRQILPPSNAGWPGPPADFTAFEIHGFAGLSP